MTYEYAVRCPDGSISLVGEEAGWAIDAAMLRDRECCGPGHRIVRRPIAAWEEAPPGAWAWPGEEWA